MNCKQGKIIFSEIDTTEKTTRLDVGFNLGIIRRGCFYTWVSDYQQ